MIVRNRERQDDVREQMRGGDGAVVIRQPGAPAAPHCRMAAELLLGPGCSIGEHIHEGESETFFILEGQGTYYDDGQAQQVASGDTCICYSGHSHALANTSDADLRVFGVMIKE